MNINKYKIKIGSIDFDNNCFIIISDKGDRFVSKIKKGSVCFKIFNEHVQEVNLSNLEAGDLVQIFGIPESTSKLNDSILKPEEKNGVDALLKLIGGSNNVTKKNNMEKTDQKNSIIIKKIMIKNKYVFNSESSEEFDSYD